MNHRTRLLQAAIALARRAEQTAWQAKLEAHQDAAKALLHRSYLQGCGACRLLHWADAHLDSPHRQS